MSRLSSLLLVFVVICGLAGSQPLQLVNAFPNLSFTTPLYLTAAGDGSNRLFVVQQNGLIRVFPGDSLATSHSGFLDISSEISPSSGEEGLLGLAFDPQFSSNGYFYVNYTAPKPLHTVISRFRVSASDPNLADPTTNVRYGVPVWGNVVFRLYDLLGRQVKALAEGVTPPGVHSFVVSSNGLSSGVFLLRMEGIALDGSQRFSAVQRLVVLK